MPDPLDAFSNAIWYVRSSTGDSETEGSAVGIRLRKEGEKGSEKTYLLTCAHVVRQIVKDGGQIAKLGPRHDKILVWPSGIGFNDRRGTEVVPVNSVVPLLTHTDRLRFYNEEIDYERELDWALLEFCEERFAARLSSIIGSWKPPARNDKCVISGYPGGKLSFVGTDHGRKNIVTPSNTDPVTITQVDDTFQLSRGDAKAGRSGGGVFTTDGAFVGIHRASLEPTDQSFGVSAQLIFRRLAEEKMEFVSGPAKAIGSTKDDVGPGRPGDKPRKVSIGRMPITGEFLVGRERELDDLDAAWIDEKTTVLTVTAWGGVGKSTLVNHWLQSVIKDSYRGANRVYAWSFYRQGATNQIVSADDFMASALQWFGDPDPAAGSARERGERLAELTRRQKTLFLLDGLEPVQRPPGPGEGRLTDDSLHAFVTEFAANSQGLLVISSRLPVSDLGNFDDEIVKRVELSHLTPDDGVKLLRAHEVRGTDDELLEACESFKGHCLALTLLANYLRDVNDGDVRQYKQIPAVIDDDRQGAHARRVMASYEGWLAPADVELLRVLGLFDRPVDMQTLDVLLNPAVDGLTDELSRLSKAEIAQVLGRLRRAELLLARDPQQDGAVDAHPLIREYFGDQLRTLHKRAWHDGNYRLSKHFKAIARKNPGSVLDIEPLFRAVAHGCRAKYFRDALNEVYRPRIQRGEEEYAADQLGMRIALLSAITEFFEDGKWGVFAADPAPGQALDPSDQIYLLKQACNYLTETQGYRPVGVDACRAKLRELIEQGHGTIGELYDVMMIDWRSSLITKPLDETLDVAEQLYRIAERDGGQVLISGACRCLADTHYFLGNFAEASHFAKYGIAQKDAQDARVIHKEISSPLVTCLAFDSLTQWHFGDPVRARRQAERGVSVAKRINDKHALAVAYYFKAFLHHFCGQARALGSTARQLAELTREQEFRFWHAGAKFLQGCHMSILRDPRRVAEGLALMKRGTKEWKDTGAHINAPYYLGCQAQALQRLGRESDAIVQLQQAIDAANETLEHWWTAELYRLKAILLAEQYSKWDEADEEFQEARRIAESQGSKSLCQRIDDVALHPNAD